MKLRACGQLIVAKTILTACSFLLIPQLEAQQVTTRSPLALVQPIQATISIQSRNLDLSHGKQLLLLSDEPEAPAKSELKKTGRLLAASSNHKKEPGRLANIWSMLIPDSVSSSSDYEDSADTQVGNESSPVTVTDSDSASTTNTTTSTTTTTSATTTTIKPTTSTTTEVIQPDGTTPMVKEPTTRSADNRVDLEPGTRIPSKASSVNFVSGSLSSGEQAAGLSSITELLSSMVSSDSQRNSSGQNPETRANLNSNDVSSSQDRQSPGDSFDRWLKRIQFQETPKLKPQLQQPQQQPQQQQSARFTSTSQSTAPIGAKLTPASIPTSTTTTTTSTTTTLKPDLVRVAEALLDMRSRRQHNPNQMQSRQDTQTSLGSNFAIANNNNNNNNFPVPRIFQMNRITALNINDQTSNNPKLGVKTSQHPFQQQLRQQQQQLIHGIKYPSAQASTISVSAQDGASNTSLSFTSTSSSSSSSSSHEASQVDVSPIINSNQQINEQAQVDLADRSQLAQQQQQVQMGDISKQPNSAVYQSQDEILRQVTSAINFEQQLINNKRSEPSSFANNHRKASEDQPVTIQASKVPESEPDSTADQLANLFKSQVGEQSINNTGPSAGRPEKPAPEKAKIADRQVPNQANGDQSSNQIEGDQRDPEVDKSYALLADKLKMLAMQKQGNLQPNINDTTPSWLRKPLAGFSLNSNDNNKTTTNSDDALARLIKNLSLPPEVAGLDTSRLSDKDKMSQLLQELIKNETSRQSNNDNAQEPKQNMKATSDEGPGWMPINGASQHPPPPSPGQLVKHKFQQNDRLRQPSSWADTKQDDRRIHMSNLVELMANQGADGHKIAPALAESLLSENNNEQAINELADQYLDQQVNQADQDDNDPRKDLMLTKQNYAKSQAIRSNQQQQSGKQPNYGSGPHQNQDVSNADEEYAAEGPAISQPAGNQQSPRGHRPADMMNNNSNRQQNQARGQDFRLHRQAQQLPAAHTVTSQGNLVTTTQQVPRIPQPYVPSQHMSPYGLPAIRGPHHMVTTITQPGGPPFRIRGMSFYKPLGFQSHHAISYQASPTISALFPSLAAGQQHHQLLRPGNLLRQMSPFRSSRFSLPTFMQQQHSSGPFSERLRMGAQPAHHHFLAPAPHMSSHSAFGLSNLPRLFAPQTHDYHPFLGHSNLPLSSNYLRPGSVHFLGPQAGLKRSQPKSIGAELLAGWHDKLLHQASLTTSEQDPNEEIILDEGDNDIRLDLMKQQLNERVDPNELLSFSASSSIRSPAGLVAINHPSTTKGQQQLHHPRLAAHGRARQPSAESRLIMSRPIRAESPPLAQARKPEARNQAKLLEPCIGKVSLPLGKLANG